MRKDSDVLSAAAHVARYFYSWESAASSGGVGEAQLALGLYLP